MGMIMPSPPVRQPDTTDDEWRIFLNRYRAEVITPIGQYVYKQAALAKLGLVAIALVAALLAALCL